MDGDDLFRETLHVEHVHGPDHHRMIRQLGFYLDMLNVLDASGTSKPDWQPPLQYALILARRNPKGALLVRRLTQLYYAARYGEKQLSPYDQRRAQSMVKALASVLGTSAV